MNRVTLFFNNIKVAIVLIIVNTLGIVFEIVTYCQAKYQLESPLVPKDFIQNVYGSYIAMAFTAIAGCIASLIFLIYKKIPISIMISCVLIIIQQLVVHVFF